MSSLKVLTFLILNQNFCSPKNIRMFLRTVREPSNFSQALLVMYTGIFCTAQFQIALIFEVEKKFSQHDFELSHQPI